MILGSYQLAGCARTLPASAAIEERSGLPSQLSIHHQETGTRIHRYDEAEYDFGDVIPGLPVDVILSDGALFTPSNPDFRWPQLAVSHSLLARLESHWMAVLVAVIVVPCFLWLMIKEVVPAVAEACVPYIPDVVAESMGEQTLYLLDKLHFDGSDIDPDTQRLIRQRWQRTITTLALPEDKYSLHFRKFKQGANAMALPDGTIILTDELVDLMIDTPDVLTAVLLHEIGHVERQHGLKLVAQSTASALVFTLIFGDIEGIGEVMLGAGSVALQNAFSRQMESEADDYAHQQLLKLGLSAALFADAMKMISASHSITLKIQDVSENEELNEGTWRQWLNDGLALFNTHPSTETRIQRAQEIESDDQTQ